MHELLSSSTMLMNSKSQTTESITEAVNLEAVHTDNQPPITIQDLDHINLQRKSGYLADRRKH